MKVRYLRNLSLGVVFCIGALANSSIAHANPVDNLQMLVKYNNLIQANDVAGLRAAISSDPSFSTRADPHADYRFSTGLLRTVLSRADASYEMVEILWNEGAELDPQAELFGVQVSGSLATAYRSASIGHPRKEVYRSGELFKLSYPNAELTSFEEWIKIIDFLIDNGANVNATTDDFHVLTSAAQAGPRYVAHLLSKGANPHMQNSKDKNFVDYINFQKSTYQRYLSRIETGAE